MKTEVENPQLGLFEGFGVEIEYMIVSRDSYDVAPVCDELIRAACGVVETEIERDELAWSNELVLHVVELKTNGPAPSLDGLAASFQADVGEIDALLAGLGARLMPTGMHPWMDPYRETRLWPHEYNQVYETFDAIFDCRGHGWANLQSTHLNLPFANDDEFGRLHAAIRLLLPILPALAASSPAIDGDRAGRLDQRLDVYRGNSRKIPSVAGRVIPERAFTRAEYDARIFQTMYRDVAPYDPDGVLHHEWLNARGAIARFDRGAIEIRVLDVQECPAADLAIAQAIVAVLRELVDERWASAAAQRRWEIEPLETILLATIDAAERARIDDASYLAAFGLDRPSCTAGELWRHLADAVGFTSGDADPQGALQTILAEGSLATRIDASLERGQSLRGVYRELCQCLTDGRQFLG